MNIEVQSKPENLFELQVILEECLATADELQLPIIAAKISEALDRFERSNSLKS